MRPRRPLFAWPQLRSVLVVAQEEFFAPRVHRGLQEESRHAEMPHLLKAAIGRVHSSADNSKLAARNLLAQQIVFGELCPFVEPAQFLKFFPIEQHEHAVIERLLYTRQLRYADDLLL